MFAYVAAPVKDLESALQASFWVWLHILQFDVSNQTVSPEEDARNKTDRPLPAGRITLRNALIFRWLLVPICFLWSVTYSLQVLYASVAIVFFTIVYDEFRFHAGNFVTRNLLNALGITSFEWGATLVAGRFYIL